MGMTWNLVFCFGITSCIVCANLIDVECQLPVYGTLFVRMYVRPEIISVTHFSATTDGNDSKFGMQLWHHELYGVLKFHWCQMSTSYLLDLNLVSTFEKFSSAKTLKLLMGMTWNFVCCFTVMICIIYANFIDVRCQLPVYRI